MSYTDVRNKMKQKTGRACMSDKEIIEQLEEELNTCKRRLNQIYGKREQDNKIKTNAALNKELQDNLENDPNLDTSFKGITLVNIENKQDLVDNLERIILRAEYFTTTLEIEIYIDEYDTRYMDYPPYQIEEISNHGIQNEAIEFLVKAVARWIEQKTE